MTVEPKAMNNDGARDGAKETYTGLSLVTEAAATLASVSPKPVVTEVSEPRAPAVTPVAKATATSFSVDTSFHNPKSRKPYSCKIRPKGSRYVVAIPESLTVNSKLSYITFRIITPEGLDPKFGSYITKKFGDRITKIKTPEEFDDWILTAGPIT